MNTWMPNAWTKIDTHCHAFPQRLNKAKILCVYIP
jgi:hypothetical protein